MLLAVQVAVGSRLRLHRQRAGRGLRVHPDAVSEQSGSVCIRHDILWYLILC